MESAYKVIEVKLTEQIPDKDIELIKDTLNFFPVREMNYDWATDKIILYLNTLDFEQFQSIMVAGMENLGSDAAKILMRDMLDRIRAIKSYGVKSKKRIYGNYDAERKVLNRVKKEAKRGQFYYAKDAGFTQTNNALEPANANRIYCADSAGILAALPGNCIDLIFTSPPYNFGLDYEATDDDHKWVKYFEKLFHIFKECIRVLKYGGRIIVNIQPLFSDYIPSHHVISHFFMENKMIWKGEILWEKNNYNCKYTAWGSWKSPGNPYLKYTWEFLEIFCKGSLKKEGETANADISGDEFKNWVYAKWSIAPEKKMKAYGHPAMFPEELARRVLKLFSFENDLVLDPFNGVGTTTFVAKQLNRRYIGIDVSPEYCKKAEARLMEVVASAADSEATVS